MKLRLAPSVVLAIAWTLSPSYAQKKAGAPAASAKAEAGQQGWFNWRGPGQDGTSPETGLPDKVDAAKPLWTADFPGQSAPVIADGKLYINGYLGEGPDLREGVTCFDADTGKVLWQHLENDYLSDIIYNRYATGAPTIDRETGNVYVQGTQGMLSCFTADGKLVWQHSLMEEYGRLTFPNGRTATPQIEGNLVITRGITNGWGANGPAGDRLLAFDKKTGDLVWYSSPADRPQDATFSPLYFTWYDGQRVFFTACGDSSIVAVNAWDGAPLWRFSAAKAGAKGGINAGVLKYKDSLLVIHESENVDTSEVGRAAAFRIPTADQKPVAPAPPMSRPNPGQRVFSPKDLEIWRNPLGNLASSPCVVGDTLYLVSGVGEVAAVNADTGVIKWRKKLGPEQRQSAPFYADGKLYVAFYIAGTEAGKTAEDGGDGGEGELFVFKPGEKDVEILSRTKLVGRCFGTPIGYNGKLYIQTDKKLYAFGKAGNNTGAKTVLWKDEPAPKAADAKVAQLQMIPNEVLLKPGESAQVQVRGLAANGLPLQDKIAPSETKIDNYIPPTALVKVKMNGKFDDSGTLTAADDPASSAGAFQAVLKTDEKVNGTMRGRVLPALPIKVDFEKYALNEMTGPGIGNAPDENLPAGTSPGPTNWNVAEPPTKFSYPPLSWNSCRFRFEVRAIPETAVGTDEGNKQALCKTIDNKLFQRGTVFIGHSDAKNYTISADVMSEGNKRKMSDIGLVNQRYQVALRGNGRTIEISSNLERIKAAEPFTMKANTWHRLKVSVENKPDGSGIVRAKAWVKTEPEPEKWTIEFEHKHAHQNGAPGFYSLSPQDQRAWIDNIEVTQN